MSASRRRTWIPERAFLGHFGQADRKGSVATCVATCVLILRRVAKQAHTGYAFFSGPPPEMRTCVVSLGRIRLVGVRISSGPPHLGA